MGEMSQFANAIDAKDWHHVRTVYQLADSAGKSSDYADRYEQNAAVGTFFEEEKQDIQNGVVGSAQYTAKQNTCKDPNQVGSSALYGLNKAVDKSLQDRIRDRDEAHDYIAAHQSAIGDKAAEKLKEQADKLSETAYIVYVGVEQNRRRLQVLVKESADVKKTLQRAAEQDATMASDATQPDADRKTAQSRATAENENLAKSDAEVQQAQHVLTEMEQRAKKLRADYEQALKSLLEAVDAKAKGGAK
jgi:chromosome segregation ATPase